MNCDVIVIGGGLSGLTTAVLAAAAGRSVTLVERSSKLGGRARSLDRQGSSLNIGPHALYRKGQAVATFRQLGIDIAGGVPPQGGVAVIEAGLHPLPVSPGLLLTTKLMTARGKLVFGGLMATLPWRRQLPVGMSWQQWLELQFPHDAGARQLLLALGRLWSYADCPDRLDAAAMLRQAQVGLGGVIYVHGGWQRLVDQLRERAEAAGVSFVHGTATRIRHDDRTVAGVTLANGERIDAATVIAAVPPTEARRLLGHDQGHPLWPSDDTAAYGSCLDLVCADLPVPERTLALHLERPLYFSNHSAVAQLSREGHCVVHLLKYQRSAAPIDPAHDRHELEEWLDEVQPGWRRFVVTERFLPQVTVACAVPEVGQPMPGVADTGVAGAFIAGDWVGGSGMLADRAVASAQAAVAAAERWLAGGAAA